MPKSAKFPDKEGKVLAAKPMGDGEKLRSFLDRVAEVQASIDAKKDDYVRACEPDRADLKEIRKEAAEAGFPPKEFATLIAKERKELELKNITKNLDDDQKERYEDMESSLGALKDTPLGAAALAAHPEARPH